MSRVFVTPIYRKSDHLLYSRLSLHSRTGDDDTRTIFGNPARSMNSYEERTSFQAGSPTMTLPTHTSVSFDSNSAEGDASCYSYRRNTPISPTPLSSQPQVTPPTPASFPEGSASHGSGLDRPRVVIALDTGRTKILICTVHDRATERCEYSVLKRKQCYRSTGAFKAL